MKEEDIRPKLITPGDLFIFTPFSSMGIDIQGLWENSKSISPPYYLIFLNPYSVKTLIKKIGLKMLKVSTPDKIDVDILSNNVGLIKDRFLKIFVKYASDSERSAWQKTISNYGWSSHMMICCQK